MPTVSDLLCVDADILLCNVDRALRDTKLCRSSEHFLRRNRFYEHPPEFILHQRCLCLHRTCAGEHVIHRDVAITNSLKAVISVKRKGDGFTLRREAAFVMSDDTDSRIAFQFADQKHASRRRSEVN